MTTLIAVALTIGLALLIVGLVFKIARKLLALVGCSIIFLALAAAAFLVFVLIPAM